MGLTSPARPLFVFQFHKNPCSFRHHIAFTRTDAKLRVNLIHRGLHHPLTLQWALMTNLLDSILHQLAAGEALTLQQMLAQSPELSHAQHGRAVLRLLLRLEPRIYATEEGKWALVAAERTPDRRIVEQAQHFLASIPNGAALHTQVVEHVAAATAYDSVIVSSVIQRRFIIRGKVVLNQLKEKVA